MDIRVKPSGNINNFDLLSRLWMHVNRKRRIQFIFSFVLMFIGGLSEVVSLGAVLPFIGILTDPEAIFDYRIVAYLSQMVGISNAEELVRPITALFILLAIFAGLLRLCIVYVTTKISFAAGHELSVDVFNKTLYQPYSIHVTRNTSQIVSAITIKVSGVVAVFQTVATLLNSTIVISMILLTLFVIEPVISAIVLASFLIYYLIISFISIRLLNANSKRISIEQDKVVKNLQEGLGGIRDVLLDSTQSLFTNIFRLSDKPLKDSHASNYIIGQTPRYLIEMLAIILLAVLASSLSNQGSLVTYLPVLVALAVAAQRILPSAQQGYAAWASIKGGHDSLYDVLELLDQKLPPADSDMEIDMLPFRKTLKLKGVNFRYSESGPLILKNIDLEIHKGKSIGIIGETGSGKSTLIDILMGLLDPSAGVFSVDDTVIDEKIRRSWQKNISHVPQNVFLADSSFASNIAFGIRSYEGLRRKIKISAHKAQISNFIESLTSQYDESVGEQGIRLSGGQKQRVGIARALYKGTNVLVLDEATSSLDDKTEEEVLKSIQDTENELTVIMIAHRLSTLKDCDHIVRMDNGEIIQQGTYKEVIEETVE